MFSRKGFTLIELVMIIVILGILAVVAIPRYYDLASQARDAAEKGQVGGIRAGIHTYYANSKAWPTNLDSVAAGSVCNKTGPCFINVLSQGGVASDWNKTSATMYKGPTGANYTYNNTDGSFIE
jgi:prepilin-type N-terminal cleavage/methylation domain-containing protein